MIYLEEFLEMIEDLPQEIRDRFTDIRELDLQVNNAIDNLNDRVNLFFQNATQMTPAEREAEYEMIRQEYYYSLKNADEKIQIATDAYELVMKHRRILLQLLQKSKLELEADNAGITEILEKRSLELDNPPVTTISISSNYPRGEKRKHNQQNIPLPYTPDKQIGTEKVFSSIATEAVGGNRGILPLLSPSSSSTSSSSSASSAQERAIVLTPQTKATFGGTNALAAAASQAIAATQQSLKRGTSQSQSNLVQQGRRTASLKASYKAVNSAKSFTVQKEKKTKMNKKAHTFQVPPLLDDISRLSLLIPYEARYCVCNQISYGEMVACDNKDCPLEWFHYRCVGIIKPPKGKWFCPQCSESMKRRNRRKEK